MRSQRARSRDGCGIATITLILAMAISAGAGEGRSESWDRGYYDEARMETMRRNLQRHEWARKQRDEILARADGWLKIDDERLRTLVPPPEVPRAFTVHEKGAPRNGEALNRMGRYSWIVSFDRPWKVTSPVDGTVYPSNDFEAFMKSGYRDRSLLSGPYPDDGWGCHVPGEKMPFWFVAMYAHWSVIRILLPAMSDLSRAYLITGDPRYAHACLVLLWQLAEYYPRYRYETQSQYGKEVDPNYLGRLLYHTWESLHTCQVVPPAYDAVKTAIQGDGALARMAGRDPGRIRSDIESRLLGTMAADIMDRSGRIQGNYGMHQVALLRIAATLRGSEVRPTSREMVDWVLSNPDAGNYTQLGMEEALNNLVHRDGYPLESPGYNLHWVLSLNEMAENLGEEGRRIMATSRFRRLFEWPIRMTCAGEYLPSYGDTNHMFHGLVGWTDEIFDPAYRHTRDPLFARALVQIGARPRHDLFIEPIDEEIEEAANGHSALLGVESQLMPGVGYASLQTGSDINRTAVALFYGYYMGHAHHDRLHLDLYSWRHALTPDFGYPETADSYDPRRFGFFSHPIAHNTVLVDARRQEMCRGRLHVYDPGPFAQVVEASAEDGYPGLTRLYRRTLMTVEVDPERTFTVDIFRVRGGSQHDWVVHGTQAEFRSDLPFSEPRRQGTLAGADVAYGDFYDDRRYANDNEAHVPYHRYEGSGFQFLMNPREAVLYGTARVSWHLNRPAGLFPELPREGVALRAHLVGKGETVYACDGIPQRRETWPDSVTFLVRRRAGKDLESLYVTVFEPYRKVPFIDSVRVLPTRDGSDMPVALEVACRDRTFTILNRLDGGGDAPSFRLPDGSTLEARAAVLERTGSGGVSRGYRLDPGDAGAVRPGPSPATERTCRVARVDYEKGIVAVTGRMPGSIPAGGIAIVESAGHADAVRVARILGDSEFSTGDEDLFAGTVHVSSADGREIDFLPRHLYFLQPGMTVVNEDGRVVGRIRSVRHGRMTLESPVAPESFPDRNGDGRRTCRIAVIGPGDRIRLHASERWGADPR